MCILGTCPFAALGFIKYNGMTAEKFVIAWIRSEILLPKKLTVKTYNYYEQILKNIEESKKQKNKKDKTINKISNRKKKINAEVKEDKIEFENFK